MSDFRVALTFDAEHPSRRQCPPAAAEQIIDTLAAHRVRASFFIQGRWATAYPALARRIAKDRHLVGNHSHFHAAMPLLSEAGLDTDVAEAQQSILEITGVDPRPWFRCPFGEGASDPQLLARLQSRGYRNIHWHVEGNDWDDERTADGLEADIVEKTVEHGDGAVVLLHSWPAPTATALPRIIERLKAAGARFVSVAELHDGR